MSCSNNACATLPPVVSDYKPRGSTTTVDGMEVYDIGAPSITTTVIVVPDIFGLSAQVKQVRAWGYCAAYGKVVVVLYWCVLVVRTSSHPHPHLRRRCVIAYMRALAFM